MKRSWIAGAAVMFGAAVVGPGAATGVASAATGVPYTDPAATGYIGLCNQAGQQVTSGNVNTTPFVWRAVSSEPAPSPYNNTGRTAILVGYQPQQALPPGDWSGEELTASSQYTNPTNPMAAFTDADDSLEDLIQDYPPKWDGFLQLRMYLGTDNEPSYQEKYPVLNVQVQGDTWHAVGGGTVNCNSGTSESIETILLPASTTTTAPPSTATASGSGTTSGSTPPVTKSNAGGSGSHGSSGTSGSSSATAGGSGAPAAKAAASGSGSSPPSGTTGSGGSSALGWLLGILAAIVVALAVVGTVLVRRRRAASAGTPTDRGPGPETGQDPPPGAAGPPESDPNEVNAQIAATKGE